MKAIIDGKRYDTETAELVAGMSCSFNRGDFDWHDTGIYRTKKGRWFLAGEGGARSIWSHPVGQNGACGGSGICPIDSSTALEHLERENAIEAIERFFSVEDA